MPELEKEFKDWKSQIKPWIPPVLLKAYKNIIKENGDKLNSESRLVEAKNIQFPLPCQPLNELFPGIGSMEVRIMTSQIYLENDWALPLVERLTLASICEKQKPKRIFEIGTYTGASTLVMAMSSPHDSKIFTLDLEPSARASHEHGLGVGGFPEFTVGALYKETKFANKVHQLSGSSLDFDYTPFYQSIDLVLIDADHSYKFVKSDTENALKMLKPGGVIIWDDYLWNTKYPECAGVSNYLSDFSKSYPCFHITNTRMAIYMSKEGNP